VVGKVQEAQEAVTTTATEVLAVKRKKNFKKDYFAARWYGGTWYRYFKHMCTEHMKRGLMNTLNFYHREEKLSRVRAKMNNKPPEKQICKLMAHEVNLMAHEKLSDKLIAFKIADRRTNPTHAHAHGRNQKCTF
jgi:hypothetical protein